MRRAVGQAERRLYTGAVACTLVCDRAASQAAPVSPMGAAARGPRVKSPRPRDPSPGVGGPWLISSCQPTGVVSAGRSGSDGQAAESAARAALRGRFEPVEKLVPSPDQGFVLDLLHAMQFR
jgi:hypothetical protein